MPTQANNIDYGPFEPHIISTCFPEQSAGYIEDLAEDIRVNGQREPILLDHDKSILDGRARFAACQLAGVEPRFCYLGSGPALNVVIKRNLRSRSLTIGQRAIIAARLDPLPRGRPPAERVGCMCAKEIAELFDITVYSLTAARRIRAARPDLASRVEQDKLKLYQARHCVIAGNSLKAPTPPKSMGMETMFEAEPVAVLCRGAKC